jgi:Protein of unknown function (DUF3072)
MRTIRHLRDGESYASPANVAQHRALNSDTRYLHEKELTPSRLSRCAGLRSALFRKLNALLATYLLFLRSMANQPIAGQEAGLQRDPDEWKTGDEPMTAAQRSYLETLCRETGEQFDDSLTKAEASKRIDELRERSPRLAGET